MENYAEPMAWRNFALDLLLRHGAGSQYRLLSARFRRNRERVDPQMWSMAWYSGSRLVKRLSSKHQQWIASVDKVLHCICDPASGKGST